MVNSGKVFNRNNNNSNKNSNTSEDAVNSYSKIMMSLPNEDTDFKNVYKSSFYT